MAPPLGEDMMARFIVVIGASPAPTFKGYAK
jgi:hypothetical protein